MSSRARRQAAKAVDYAKEQEFSDDDVFEDGLNQETPPSVRKKSSSRTRKVDDAGLSSMDVGYEASKQVYTEKGYDPSLPPIRERFTFSPEFEPDGSPKIELIVGRRPIEDKKRKGSSADPDTPEGAASDDEEESSESEDERPRRGRKSRKRKKKKKPKKKTKKDPADMAVDHPHSQHVEYEYLVKYKGRSYLHLEWKTGADLESMNKSAKTLYRRFLKKLAAGTEEDLEDPSFDPAFAQPGKIVDEEDQEVFVELSDKELVEWEKERQRELEEEEAEDEQEEGVDAVKIEGLDGNKEDKETAANDTGEDNDAPPPSEAAEGIEAKEKEDEENNTGTADEAIGEPGTVDIETLRKIINRDGPYYPSFEDSDNPYRDGYITEPPKKPRASYLFFQCCYRGHFQRKYAGSTVGEVMTKLGEAWRDMGEVQQAPFIILAREEQEQYEKERAMMEKAQKPNEMWQPLRRCRMVLDRISADGFSNIFQEPVDTEQFPDYEEFVDQPMDLGTVRDKLARRKYQAPENFARDMRRIWNNCKVYNQHGSAIWHVADYMSKQFERLYHAWVLEYRDRYLRWINPKARPWEHSCRECDGKCATPDEKMVLCDHCDAMYGMACLKPPLSKLPTGVWQCPDCQSKIRSKKGVRLLSAVSEQAARKRAEIGDIPKKKVMRKMFLVKWAGLGYEHCTWETQKDVGDDALIAEFRRLNNMTPDEPDLKEEEVQKFLEKQKHLTIENAGGISFIPDMRSQLYSQTRAFHFLKFGKELPELLCGECGPKTNASSAGVGVVPCSSGDGNDHASSDSRYEFFPKKKPQHQEEVLECLSDLVTKVSRNETRQNLSLAASLPPPLTGEYDAVVPITSKGLMMNVGEIHGSVAFLGYRAFPDGSKGPSELSNLIRNVGDKIIAVDGQSTINKTFKEVIMMLRESGKNKFAYMRFLENKYAVCNSELASVGSSGLFVADELKKKFVTDRRRLLVKRLQDEGTHGDEDEKDEDKDSDGSVGSEDNSDDDDSDSDSSEGQFVPDSDDDELVIKQRVKQHLAGAHKAIISNGAEADKAKGKTPAGGDNVVNPPMTQSADKLSKVGMSSKTNGQQSPSSFDDKEGEEKKMGDGNHISDLEERQKDAQAKPDVSPSNNNQSANSITSDANGHGQLSAQVKEDNEAYPSKVKKIVGLVKPLVHRRKTTRCLAYQLLDVDIGYSSDEGGDEDCAYYLDGVDNTFSSIKQISEKLLPANEKDAKDEQSPKDSAKDNEVEDIESKLPVKRSEFSTLGDRAKLYAAVNFTRREPDPDDFDNYPHPSSKELAAKMKEEDEAKERDMAEKEALEEKVDNDGVEKPKKKSTTKIEQLSTTTNDVIRIWANVEEAAATLQLPIQEIKQILKGEYSEDIGDEVGGYRWRYADNDAEVTKSASSGKDSKGKKAFLEFRDKLYDHENPHSYKNGNRLRDYQIDGVNWLASCWYKRHSCILADEMGLGKTVQIVTYIEHLFRAEKILRPFLVVVPLSTVEHWRREFEGWTDMQCCVYHDRQRVWRDVMREYEWYYADRPHTAEFLKFDVLVTTYDTLIGDFDVIGQIPWRVTVVDEAHRLRNVKGKLLECMKEISAKGTLQYGFQSRVLMTGTPLQNNTQELWTLLNFIEPYKFPSLEDFQLNFGNMANRDQVEALQRKISPFMLRRVKEDVAKDIPAKEETVIDVELTSIQKQYYRAIFEHNHAFLSMGATRNTAPKLMNIQMELRKCCNHPFLLDGIESREMEKAHKELMEKGELDGKTAEEQHTMLNVHGYIQTSGKMVLLDKLLPKLRQEGHKVLIFSQMVKMLDLISDYCDFRGFRHERLDGRVRGNERQKAIDRFETEDDSFIFLLSTRAGGVGINLTAADICIIFDSDWNPQNDVQAQARCHRIGQTKDVMIYRLITSRSFETEMFDRASKKLGLEQAVLGTFGQDNDDDKPTSKEMEQLLKKGAYALLEDENDEMGKEFCADDIESILAKRTRTRVVEGAKTASWLNKQGMMVSKSKFTADAANADVDVDDPLFWQKVMPDFVTPTIMLTKLKDLSKLAEKQAGAKKKTSANNLNAQDGAEGGDQLEKGVKGQRGKNASDAFHISRGNQKKINKFMSDVTSMMDGIFEQAEDDALPPSEKSACQKLLLTISVKQKMFNEEQRSMAKIMLKRLEGDRRRRCRTNGTEPGRFSRRGALQEEVPEAAPVPKQLLITKHKRRRRRRKEKVEEEEEEEVEEEEEEETTPIKESNDQSPEPSSNDRGYVGEDGYLHHSDSEADWSDVADDLYHGRKKKPGISKKEARRRRAWASDKDAATAAGRPWPSFPRNVVSKVLGSLLDEMIRIDEAKGGIFSVPVSREEYPEYYELVKQPMDYGTMREKLVNGEYRSAQAMQKDFVLVMQNCLLFNAPDSDIVKEARDQALMRPKLLRKAAMDNNLFLSEDGTILEVHSDNEDKEDKGAGDEHKGGKKLMRKKRSRRKKDAESSETPEKKTPERVRTPGSRLVRCGECEGCKREDCGECVACQDKRKFGGKGTLKQGCHRRQCNNMKEQMTNRPIPRKKSKRNSSRDDLGSEDHKEEKRKRDAGKDDDDSTKKSEDASSSTPRKKRPRIRITLSVNGSSAKSENDSSPSPQEDTRIKKKKRPLDEEATKAADVPTNERKKRKRKKVEKYGAEVEEGEVIDTEDIPTSSAKKKKKDRSSSPKRKPEDDDKEEGELDETTEAIQNDSADVNGHDDDPAIDYMNQDLIKEERQSLDKSIEQARHFFTKRGPWKLPKAVGEEKFGQVAKYVLNKIVKFDTYQLFEEEVTEDEAPGYHVIVKQPMDFGTMKKKLEKGEYGEGSEAMSAVYHDFLLVIDNCILYNDEGGEVVDEAARVVSFLPEIFANACTSVSAKSGKRRKSR